MNSVAVGAVFWTGQECQQKGYYGWDGYLDGSHQPAPSLEELSISLFKCEVFPPIRSSAKGCFWRLIALLD